MKKDEYYARLEKAINFIENNLDKKFSLAAVSKNAFSSLSHFHRIFYFMTGLTMKEYIRRRRLSKAGIELISTDKKIINIALEAQFESPESFNKAFKKMFGYPPREFRQLKLEFKIVRKMEFDPNLETNQPKNIELNFVYLSQQLIAGVKIRTTLENNQQTLDIPNFFGKVMQEKLLADIPNVIDRYRMFGVYSDMSDEEEFDYTVGLLVDQVPKLSQYSHHVLPVAEYARFSVHGDPSQLESAWRYIYGIWMPNSGKLRQNGLDFEIYSPEKTDIYIPMRSQNDTKYQV